MSPNQKLPPYSLEAEENVLGAMMLDNRIIVDIAEVLSASDFYREDHQQVFEAILGDYAERKSADFTTVADWLDVRGRLAKPNGHVGGISLPALASLANDTPSAANARAYAAIVRERAVLRSLIQVGGDIAELGFHPDGRSTDELLDAAEQGLMAMRHRNMKPDGTARTLAELMESAERAIESRKGGTGVTGLPTGLVDLDAKTTGLHGGDLIYIAGRPGQGKTTLATCIAEHCAFSVKKPALIFSMEMPAGQITERLIASQTSVPLSAIRSGQLSQLGWDAITAAGGRMRRAPLMIDDTGALSPNALRARARRVAAKGGIGLIVVDYIQLMQVPGSRDNRTNDIAAVSRSLKALAKELDVPVIALSQLNRSVESRENKRPKMADLRESGGLEQDADIVLMVYRDEEYDPQSRWSGTAEIIIEKQRNGERGTVRTAFRKATCRFENLAPGWEPAPDADQKSTRKHTFTGRRSSGSTHAAYAAPND